MTENDFIAWLFVTLRKLPTEERYLLQRDLSDEALDMSVWVSNNLESWGSLFAWETGKEYVVRDRDSLTSTIVTRLKKEF